MAFRLLIQTMRSPEMFFLGFTRGDPSEEIAFFNELRVIYE